MSTNSAVRCTVTTESRSLAVAFWRGWLGLRNAKAASNGLRPFDHWGWQEVIGALRDLPEWFDCQNSTGLPRTQCMSGGAEVAVTAVSSSLFAMFVGFFFPTDYGLLFRIDWEVMKDETARRQDFHRSSSQGCRPASPSPIEFIEPVFASAALVAQFCTRKAWRKICNCGTMVSSGMVIINKALAIAQGYCMMYDTISWVQVVFCVATGRN